MTTVNEKAIPIEPVLVNFWWDESGPEDEYTFDGDTYPYKSPEPNYRYFTKTTFTNELIEFFAILSKKQEEEFITDHPKVVPPTGVKVLEYLWDFGDGTTGYGPFVEHEYRFVQPDISIRLTVVDDRGLEWSRAKPLNLVYRTLGFIARLNAPL